IALATSAPACRHRAASDGELTYVPERIVHGVVSVTGTSFEQHLVLEAGNGPLRLHASPSDSADLSRVQGAEVSVRGVDDTGGLRVRSFTVTRVGNSPAVDGIIRRDGDRLFLEQNGSRLALGNPPAPFKDLVGARVWVQGSLTTGPNQYGVIHKEP